MKTLLYHSWFYEKNIAAVITAVLFLITLAVVAVKDAKTKTIPDRYCVWIGILALLAMMTVPELVIKERLLGMVSVSIPMFLLSMAVPGAFGGGDIKLMSVCGIFLGWRITVLSMVIAIFLGAAYSLILLIGRKKGRKETLAFGPFLSVGMAIGLLYGEWLLTLL